MTITPWRGTDIGVGYRSAINQDIKGTLFVPAAIAGSTVGSATTSVALPDTWTFGIRHRLDQRWTVMGTFEYARWSRIGTSIVNRANGAQATVGGVGVTVPFEYRDGWFASVGAEYQWNQQWALRAGLGFERSPVTDTVRTPVVPDNDRIWASVGASNNLTANLRLDFAYTHIFVRGSDVNVIAGNPNFSAGTGTYQGSVNAQVDIFSVGLKYNWDEPAPARKLITK